MLFTNYEQVLQKAQTFLHIIDYMLLNHFLIIVIITIFTHGSIANVKVPVSNFADLYLIAVDVMIDYDRDKIIKKQ